MANKRIQCIFNSVCKYRILFYQATCIASLCNRKSCQVLLRMGAEVDSRDNKFRTPLMWASHGNHTKCAVILLDSKASVDLQDVGSDTALHVACGQGHPAIVKLLLDHGASSALRNKQGLTCLEVAAKAGSCDAAMAIAKHERLAEYNTIQYNALYLTWSIFLANQLLYRHATKNK